MRTWSDGPHDDLTRAFELNREAVHAHRISAQVADLKVLNAWLALQLDCPWRIENYRAAPATEKRVMRAAT